MAAAAAEEEEGASSSHDSGDFAERKPARKKKQVQKVLARV